MQKSADIVEFAKAMAIVQGLLKPAAKDSINPHFKSKYADLAAIVESARSHLAANGLFTLQDLTTTEKGVSVVTLVMHTSGQWVEFGPLVLPAMKYDAQGLGSAATYARRYGLAAALNIVVDEDDDGNASTARGAAKASGGSGGGYVKPVTVPAPGETVTITVGEPKSAPGVSSAKEEVRQAIREVNACGDADSLTGLLPSLKDLCMKVAKIYPGVWVGEEEYSGLRGAIQKAGYDFMMAESVNKWLGKVDDNSGFRIDEHRKAMRAS